VSYVVSVYENLFRPRAATHELSGEQLVDLLTTHQRVCAVRDKRTLPMWSPVLLRPAYRRKINVVHACCLVLDYDDGTTIDDAMTTWSRWYRIMHTSWSHALDHHRYRIVLPLKRDVSPDEYPTLWRWAEQFSGREVDKACKDVSRAWALPALDPEDATRTRLFRADVGLGELLDPDEVIPLAPPPPVKINYKRIDLQDLPDTSHLKEIHLTPESRAELGHAVGGAVRSGCVKMVECPRCRRDSVWWWVDPDILAEAVCNHRKSCGWRGPLVALVEYQRSAGLNIEDALRG